MTTMDACEAGTGDPEVAGQDAGPLVMDLAPGQWFRLAGEQSRRLFMVAGMTEWMGRSRTPMVPCNGLGLDSSLRSRRCRVRGDREAIPLAGYALLGALADVVDGYTPSPLASGVSV